MAVSLRGPWSLRRRLVVGVAALLAVLAVVIGVTSVAVLNGQLVQRLDGQLTDAAKRSGNRVDPRAPGSSGPGVCSDPSGFQLAAVLGNQGAGAVGTVSCDGGTRYLRPGYLNADGEAVALTDAQAQALIAGPADNPPHTVALGSLGDYRVISQRLSPKAVVVVALPMAEVQNTTTRLTVIVIVVTLIALALAVVLGLLVVGIALRPLTRVAATATRVSELRLEDESSLGQRVPEGDARPATEVGRVGQALNRLLDRVESALQARTASEDKLRRFVADASHELRTPLASIRGYSELSRRFDDELPEDVRHSLDRIGSESVRMTVLVEDLLLLARLDSGGPIAHEPVDLGRLLVDAVGDAHAAAPDHEWILELPHSDDADEDAEPREIRVLGDAPSLHQVVANLLANARTHTPAGTRVTVHLREEGEQALVEVADAGPGIPESVRASLFERFVRGDDSRSRAAGSTGLGLSIAEAIVRAHRGSIDVESEPGRTVFRVRIPLVPYAEAAAV